MRVLRAEPILESIRVENSFYRMGTGKAGRAPVWESRRWIEMQNWELVAIKGYPFLDKLHSQERGQRER
jgi:hypothetical protein